MDDSDRGEAVVDKEEMSDYVLLCIGKQDAANVLFWRGEQFLENLIMTDMSMIAQRWWIDK